MADDLIERLSERTGYAVEKVSVLSALNALQKCRIATGFLTAVTSNRGLDPLRALADRFAHAGKFNGMTGEWFEEDVGKFSRWWSPNPDSTSAKTAQPFTISVRRVRRR